MFYRTPAEPGPGSHPSNFSVENQGLSHEASYQSFDGVNQFKMSYNKANQERRNGTNGTTHVTELHAVPGYTCLIDEFAPLRSTEGDKSLSALNGIHINTNFSGEIMNGKHSRKVSSFDSPGGPDKQASMDGVKYQNKFSHSRSNSNDMFFDAFENGCKAHPSKVPPPSSQSGSLGSNKGYSKTSMGSRIGVSNRNSTEEAPGVCSPPYFDEEVDTNSVAAASAAAVKKAIEEAQAKIKIAKEIMERKKDGLQNHVKLGFDDGPRVQKRREGKITDPTNKFREEEWLKCGKGDAPVQVFARPEKLNAMKAGQAAPDFRERDDILFAEEASGGTPGEKNRATVMDCKREEMNDLKAEKWGGILTKLVQSVNDLELKERFFTMKIFENPEENGKKLQVFEEAHKQEEAERKCNAAQTACQLKEDVYEPKLDQGVHDQEQYGKKASVSGLQEEKEVTFDTSPKVEAREKKQRRLWDLTGGNLVLQLRDNEHTKIKILQEEQVWLENENKGKEVLEEKESDTRSKDFPETEEHEFTLEENFDPEENGKRDEATYEKVEFEDQQKESCRSKESEGGLGDVHDREDAENASDKAEEQENVGVTINGFHDREQGGEKLGEDVELGAKGELMEAEENDQRLEESHEWEETEKVHRQIDHRKEDEKMKVTQEACEHFRNDPEVANDIYIEDKTDSLNETPVASVHRENDEYHEVPTYEDNEGLVEVSQASSECKERETESNVVDLANDQEEKGILEVEIAGLAQVVLELHSEIQKQVKDTAKAQASEHKGLNIGVSDMDVWKKSSDQYEKEPSTFNDAGNFVEELTSESEENFEDVEEVEAAMKQGEDESNSERSREERWIDNGENVDATQVSSMFQGKGESTETSQSTEHGKDNHSETLKTVGMEAEGTMQKEVGLQKGCESKLDEVKEKEREREKERIAVERAIREARERAFTEARERAERAAVANAEARRRAMAEAQETLGRAAAEVNDKLAAERTSMEARLKAERAAVERATAEARERALEKAMSKKATSQSRNQAVKSSGSSSENGIRHSSASNVSFPTFCYPSLFPCLVVLQINQFM